jgi:uncharacterized LabA/DUF88 family protein
MSNNYKHDYEIRDDERVAIFIDGSNLYHSLEENCRRYDVDFGAFSAKLAAGRPHLRTYYYNVLRDPDRNHQAYQDQQKFLTALHSTPYLEVRLGVSKLRGDVPVEKGVDIMIATDFLRMAWNDLYDTAILVSGDGDFSYAVQAVKDLGKHVVVAAFKANLSKELGQVADSKEYFTPEYFADIWSRRRGPERSGSYNNNDQGRRFRRPSPSKPRQPEDAGPDRNRRFDERDDDFS